MCFHEVYQVNEEVILQKTIMVASELAYPSNYDILSAVA